jgi:hypothetical protein
MKYLLIVLICFIVVPNKSIGQQKRSPKFPDDFTGNWKGELVWSPVGKPDQHIPMQLLIQPSADTAGHFTWHIIYNGPAKDSRPYSLRPIDSLNGHWLIDERNGILLDQYWLGNRFSGAFSVSNSTIVNTYYLDNDNLIVEFFSYPVKPVRTSGKGNDEVPFVNSYAAKSFQRAVLSRF